MPHQHDAGGELFALLSLLLIGLALMTYVYAAQRQWREQGQWSPWQLSAWISGCLLLAIAVSPPLLTLAHIDLRAHMVQHLLLGMLAPICLVLAAPITLALRSLPRVTARALATLLRSPPVRLVSHPLTALLLNVGGMYVLYLTPLYSAMQNSAVLHALVHFHFLAAGYLFTWSVLAGPDPAPHPQPMRARLAILFLSMAAHAYLGKIMYGYLWPRDTSHSVEEVQAAAQVMYYGGDLSELLLVIALFAFWYRRRGSSRASRAYSLRLLDN